jgi:succinate dehydrogenase/fumarate reductase flavoprotein subunit
MSGELRTPALVRATDVTGWDDEADVVIVGLGAAGASAAIQARRGSADVLVLERASGGGGASASLAATYWAAERRCKACGFQDTAEEMYRYPGAHAGARCREDPGLLRRQRRSLRLA